MPSIEDLINGEQPKEIDDKKKNKFIIIRNKLGLYVKELKYPIVLTVAFIGLGVGTKYTLLDSESQFTIQNMYGTGKQQLEQMETNSVTIVNSTATSKIELADLQGKITKKKEELDEANATITNLTQGYYFIAYLDSLFNKHKITLDKFDINLQGTQIESQVGNSSILTLDNLVDIQIPKGDYSLLPIDIKFTTSSENLRLLFNEFYTRRIVYDKDLKITNNFDNSVTVETKIEFVKSTNTDELLDNQQVTEELVSDPNLEGLAPPEGTDPWATGSNQPTQDSANQMPATQGQPDSTTNQGSDIIDNSLYKNTTPSVKDAVGQ